MSEGRTPNPPTETRSLGRRIREDPMEVVVGGLFHRHLHPTLVETSRGARLQSVDPEAVLAAVLPPGDPALTELAREFDESWTRLRSRVRDGLLFAERTAFLRGEGWILYALARRLRPEQVVETGVANGHSSFLLLEALRRNGRGRLVSFDVVAGAGELVPQELRSGWDLRILPQRGRAAAFRDAMALLGPVGLFLHDSAHSYGWMELEFRAAWARLVPGGVLAADDIDWSYAFLDFARSVGTRPVVLVEASKPFGLLARPAGSPVSLPATPHGASERA
ncbi:MAG: class I SAM-dependent methyltransferase [Thermoplasmata archaeon]|nr:class I SAM-dependent methyltransferase [Thermoplasmata archaeon]